jgi:hypothetical protein
VPLVLEQVAGLAQGLDVVYGVRAPETKRDYVVNREGLLTTTAETAAAALLHERKPLLGGEVFTFIAKGQSPAPGGQCGGHELEALAHSLSNRAPELPQDPDLPRVEHLNRCVGLPVLQEAHGRTSGGEQLIGGYFGGLLSYT